MYCPYCRDQLVGCIGRCCASCGKDIQFMAPALVDVPLSDEMTEAALFLKHRSEGQKTEDAEKLEPGDLIEIFRGRYQHWAVYVGDHYVVHLVALGKSISGASSTVSECPVGGQIKKEKFQDVIKNDYWKISNIHDEKLTPRSKKNIVKEALSRVGNAVNYNITNWNCEHFATWCRYGKGLSLQAEKIKKAVRDVSGKGGDALLQMFSASSASLSKSHSSLPTEDTGETQGKEMGNESGEEMRPMVIAAADQPARPDP